jgi:hypothetical protein
MDDTTAIARSVPARPDRRILQAGTWGGVAAASAFGFLADAAARAPSGLALTLGTWLAGAAVLALVRPRRAVAPFVVAACAIGACLTLHASPVLTGLNVFAAGALLCAGASFATLGTPIATTTRSYLARLVWSPLQAMPEGAASLAGPPTRLLRSRRGTAGGLARGLLLVVPVALALLALLASADAVFARYVRVPIRVAPGSIASHALVLAVGALALATLVAVGTLGPSTIDAAAQRPARPAWARAGDWVALLVVADVIFGAFVAVQFTVFFGGRAQVLTAEGLTYAQHARTGFWQLLGATAIAGGVLAFAWAALPRPMPRGVRLLFQALGLVLIVFVLVVLVSAFQRLALYEGAYGYTWLRMLVHTAILAIGALLLCTMVAVVRARAAWLPFAAVVIATAAVLGLNIVNLDAFIATRNISRAANGAPLDTRELTQLSADAAPSMAGALDSLTPAARTDLEGVLACMRDQLERQTASGWAGSNRARDLALEALTERLLPPCRAPRGPF